MTESQVEILVEKELRKERCFGHYAGLCPNCFDDDYNKFCEGYRPVVFDGKSNTIEICLGHLGDKCVRHNKPGQRKLCIFNEQNRYCPSYVPVRFVLIRVNETEKK